MDLIPYGTKNELTLVAVLTMVPGQLLAIPGNLVAGYLSKRRGLNNNECLKTSK